MTSAFEVRVDWVAAETAPSRVLAESERWLDDAERERVGRFLVAHARRDYLIGRWLLRRALAVATGVAPETWRFALGRHGRPAPIAAAGREVPDVNLSHGGGLVVCASSRGGVVGVDVEASTRNVPTLDLARYFSPEEAQELRALPARLQDERFWRLWTLKEAWLKARGTGIAGSLSSFTVRFRDPDPPGITGPDDAVAWRLRELRLAPAYFLAVAVLPHAPAEPALVVAPALD